MALLYPTLSNGIVAAYDAARDTGADAEDQFGNLDGTLVNGATRVISDGKLAYSLDGSNDRISFDSHAASFMIGAPAAISFWINSASDATQCVFSLSVSSVSNRFLQIGIGDGWTSSATNELILLAYANGVGSTGLAYTTPTRSELINSGWHHILVTTNGSIWRLYLDGAEKTLAAYQGSNDGAFAVTGPTSCRWGNRNIAAAPNSLHLAGLLDGMVFYNRVPTADERGYLASRRDAVFAVEEEPEPVVIDLGQSASTEIIQALLASNPRSYTLGQSSSTEATQPLATLNPREYTAGQSGSVEASQPLIVSNPRSYEIGQSSSSESVHSLTVSQTGSFSFGQSSSTESVQSLVVVNPRSYTFGQSSSVESSAPLEVSQADVQTAVIGQSSSIEAVLPLIVSSPRTYVIGQSVSTEHVTDLIASGGAVTTTNQFVFQTINGTYLFQTQS